MLKKKYTYEDFSKLSFDDKKKFHLQAKAKKPNFIPVILFKHPKSNFPTLPECRMLVPENFTVMQFKHEVDKISKGMKEGNKAEEANFLFANSGLMSHSNTMKVEYEKYLANAKNSDGWFYILISPTAVF